MALALVSIIIFLLILIVYAIVVVIKDNSTNIPVATDPIPDDILKSLKEVK